MRYRLKFGDYSGDGHSQTETYVIDVHSAHTVEQMRENYQRNCSRWGYTLEEIAEEYEDSSVPAALTRKMRADGSSWVDIADRSYADGLNGEDDDELYIGLDTALRFVMDFIGLNMPPYNGEPFTWVEVGDEDLPTLIGGWGGSNEIARKFGYGLFY